MRIKDRPRRNCRSFFFFFFFWRVNLQEGKQVVRIKKKKSRSCSLFSSSNMPRAGHWGLRDSPTRISIVLEPKKVTKETLFDDVYIKLSSITSHRIDIQGHYYFSIWVKSFKVHTLASSGPGIQFSVIQEWINIVFRMESLELQAPGFISNHAQTQAKWLILFTSVLWWFS